MDGRQTRSLDYRELGFLPCWGGFFVGAFFAAVFGTGSCFFPEGFYPVLPLRLWFCSFLACHLARLRLSSCDSWGFVLFQALPAYFLGAIALLTGVLAVVYFVTLAHPLSGR